MSTRPRINSQALQERYSSYYGDLFGRCKVVVSSSDSFFWSGEFARFFGGLAILQKLPTKDYIGLEILETETICFADSLYGFSPSENEFISIKSDAAKEKRLLSFLNKFWATIRSDSSPKGFRIHLLSESHSGGGLGTTGVYLTCLAAAIYILAGKISSKQIEDFMNYSSEELINDANHEDWRKIFRLGWTLTSVARDGYSSGASIFGAMMHTAYPIFYASDSNQAGGFVRDKLKNIDDRKFWGAKIEELFPVEMPQPWPIDMGRVYSGTLINTETIIKMLSKFNLDVQKIEQKIDRELVPKIKGISAGNLFDLDNSSGEYCSYMDFVEIYNMLSAKLSFAIKDLFTDGSSEDNLRQFFMTVEQLQDFGHFMGHSNAKLDSLCEMTKDIISKDNEFGFSGAKIEGVGKGGHILFAGPVDTFSNKIYSAIEKKAEETGEGIYLDWASWIDGFGESGVTVEQSLSEGKYSSFVAENSVLLRQYANGVRSESVVGQDYNQKVGDQFDIVFDLVSGKVTVRGKALHSKEMPSAKSTCDIFNKILKSDGYKITNKAFLASSYGQSRYDLQGKIMTPVKRVIETYCNKKFNFSITGGMYDDYSVSININNLKIAVIEKLR